MSIFSHLSTCVCTQSPKYLEMAQGHISLSGLGSGRLVARRSVAGAADRSRSEGRAGAANRGRGVGSEPGARWGRRGEAGARRAGTTAYRELATTRGRREEQARGKIDKMWRRLVNQGVGAKIYGADPLPRVPQNTGGRRRDLWR
jgi:hypothetical protein